MWNKLNKSMMLCQGIFGLSFYGVMAILTRFFLEDLKYSEADTMMVVGAFSSIGPLFAIAGGFITDKFLGAYRSLSIAFSVFTAGFVLLVFGASAKSVPISLSGIALASYARGLMSPSFPAIFKNTFGNEEDFEKGLPINYSVNNVGALLGQYLYPLMILSVGFSGGFLLSSVMAGIAVFTLFFLKKPFVEVASDLDRQPVSKKTLATFLALSAAMIGLVFFMFSNMDVGKNIVYVIGVGAILYFIFLMFKAEKSDTKKMGAILIMIY
jgi:dipeptide/tripeptide permease